MNAPLDALRHNVSGAIARGETEPVTGEPAPVCIKYYCEATRGYHYIHDVDAAEVTSAVAFLESIGMSIVHVRPVI